MSVVTYRDGILAADSRAYGGRGQCSPGIKAKVHKLPDGQRVGVVSATLGEPERFLSWLRDGGRPTDWVGDKPGLRALRIDGEGRVFLYEDSIWPSGPISTANFYAIGSGSDFALGAMHMGATAGQAVEAAIRFDGNCGAPVRVIAADGEEY